MRFSILIFVFTCLVTPFSVLAEDTLIGVVARLKVRQASVLRYVEMRQIQLLAEPWEGAGLMYLAPEVMVVEQKIPKHSIVVITRNTMRYVETENKLIFTKRLKRGFDLPGIGSFLQLLYSDSSVETLEEKFHTSFTSTDAEWSLELAPRASKRVLKMQLIGNIGEAARELSIHFMDGDSNTWSMTNLKSGEMAANAVDQVLARVASVKPESDLSER